MTRWQSWCDIIKKQVMEAIEALPLHKVHIEALIAENRKQLNSSGNNAVDSYMTVLYLSKPE